MKPKALLQSCDNNFSQEFIQLVSDKLDVSLDPNSGSSFSYYYFYASDDIGFLNQTLDQIHSDMKAVVVCSYRCKRLVDSLHNKPNVKILYYGELISEFSKGNIVALLRGSKNGSLTIPASNISLDAISMSELSGAMLECTFTYYSNKTEEFIVSNDLTYHSLAHLLKEKYSDINIQLSQSHPNLQPLPDSKIKLPTDKDYLFGLYEGLETNTRQSKSFQMPKVSVDISIPKLPSLNADKLFKYSTIALSLPVLVFLLSAASLYAGFWGLNSNPNLSEFGFKVARNISLHNSFRESAKLGERVLAVSDSANFDFENASPDELREYLSELQLTLNTLYKDMSFNQDSYLFSEIISQSRETVLKVHDVLEVAPILLGLNKEETYALVFQDKNLITSVMYVEVKDGDVEYVDSHNADEIDDFIPGEIESPFASDNQWQFSHVTWGGDFSIVSESIKWFMDKSINVNPQTVIMVPSKNRELFEKRFTTGSSLLDMDFLVELLKMSNDNSIAAHSENIQLQAFFDSQDMSMSITGASNEFLLDEFSDNGVDKEIERDVLSAIKYRQESVLLDYTVTYKNSNENSYLFWPKLHMPDEVTVDEVTYLRGDEKVTIYPEISKNNNVKTVSSYIDLKPNEEIAISYKIVIRDFSFFDSTNFAFYKALHLPDMEMKLTLSSTFPGVVNTTPAMNLTSPGELSYTTALEEVLNLEIKIRQ